MLLVQDTNVHVYNHDDEELAGMYVYAGILLGPPSAFPESYDTDLYMAHIEALYKGLLIHLDDPSPEIQVSAASACGEVLCIQCMQE